MPIWLNYTHEHVAWGILLPNYIYFLNNFRPLTRWKLFSGDEEETQIFLTYIEEDALRAWLKDTVSDKYFDVSGIRNILFEAYPYEVEMKCLANDIKDDTQRNERLIASFNNFFAIDYEQVLQEYIASWRKEMCKAFLEKEDRVYEDRDEAVELFMKFVKSVLQSEWYAKEAYALELYMKDHLHISYVTWISWVTSEKWWEVYIEVGNNTYITLLHELVHFVNRYFRYHYFEKDEVCFDHFTRTNEWLSNFIAYHCIDQILETNIEGVEEMSMETLFVSSYIDVYATLREEWTNDRNHNFSLIAREMKKFEGDLLTPEKTDFYIQRFYKFFHYDQHEYFYPKELMYHIGYHEIREIFNNSNNKKQLLAQCFLWKVCV